MASITRPSLLPQCTSCIRRVTRMGLEQRQQQQTRNISKAAKEAERNIVVKLLHDIPRFGRAGSYVPINPGLMRNKWFPARVADYVPVTQLKQLKAQEVDLTRDTTFGVRVALEEAEAEEEVAQQAKPHYVRPIEIEQLSAERTMELIDTFVPPTIDFARQLIEQEKTEAKRYSASNAADILNAAIAASKPKALENAIYGSVSSADIVATIKSALAHNDEAARVILSEKDVNFVSGHEEGDPSKVKQLGRFKVEIKVPGAAKPLTRQVRIRAKE